MSLQFRAILYFLPYTQFTLSKSLVVMIPGLFLFSTLIVKRFKKKFFFLPTEKSLSMAPQSPKR